MTEVINIIHKRDYSQMKEWQLDAFINSILYCCTWTIAGHYDVAKIVRAYKILGDDVFDRQEFKSRSYVLNAHKGDLLKELTNYLRLSPIEYKKDLHDICTAIIEGYNDELNRKIRTILNTELL